MRIRDITKPCEVCGAEPHHDGSCKGCVALTLAETARYEARHGSGVGCAGLLLNLADALDAALRSPAEARDGEERT
jgi:hypothetical protein